MICGDSYSAISNTVPGTSYSELLADKLGWELHNYARSGCSNGGIRVQITEAIKQSADFVIVIPTSWDRIEIPAAGGVPVVFGQNVGWDNNPLQDSLLDDTMKNGYDSDLGIKNINYSKNVPSTMIFEMIYSLAENMDNSYRARLSKHTQQAVKNYVNFMYDHNWKQQCDQWIIYSGIVALHDAGIPFSIEPGCLWNHWPRDKFDTSLPTFIDPRVVRRTNEETAGFATSRYPLDPDVEDPGYHGNAQSQEYLSEIYYKVITDLWKIQ